MKSSDRAAATAPLPLISQHQLNRPIVLEFRIDRKCQTYLLSLRLHKSIVMPDPQSSGIGKIFTRFKRFLQAIVDGSVIHWKPP